MTESFLPVPRRARLAHCLATLLLALTALASLPVANAAAASAPTGLRSTALAPTTVALTWKPVAKAPRYRIQYSTKSSMAGATYRRFTDPRGQLAGLQPRTTYYVKVRVISRSGKNLSPYSRAITVTTTAPPPSGLQATAVTQTTMSLSWNAVARVTRYRLQYSTKPSMASPTYRRYTGPRAQVVGLQPRTTYYVRARAISTSGASLSGYSAAVQVTTPDFPLRVASYNVRCANCFAGLPDELRWEERRSTVVEAIQSQDLDVLGVQEASQGWLKDVNGDQINLSQFEDLHRHLGAPWELTNDQRNNCVRSTTPTRCQYQDQGASGGTRIFYNSARVEAISSGSKLLGSKTDGSSPRYLAWAVLRQRSTGAKFFFADSHLEDDKDLYALRKSEAEDAVRTIEERNAGHLPVIAVGDFNSSRFSDPTNAPYDAYLAAGFSDPIGNAYNSTRAVDATAERVLSTWLNSFNGFVRHARGHRDWDNGSYLDYMLTTPMRVSEWETVARLDAKDDFVGVIPSDHNMLRMTVYLPR